MKPVSPFEALFHVVPWQIRRPVPRDVTLLHDADFTYHPGPTSAGWDEHRNR